MGFGIASGWCGSHSKPLLLLQKSYIFYVSETLAAYLKVCLRKHALDHVHRPLPTNVS